MKLFSRSSLLISALSTLLGLISPQSAQAQFLGYVSPQTVQQVVFNAVAGPGTVNVSNYGQNIHFVYFTRTNVGGLFDLRIEGSIDGINFFPISEDFTNTGLGSGVLYAVGYYPVIRVNLASFSSGTITVSYSGTSASASPPIGSYSPGMALTKVIRSNSRMDTTDSPVIFTPYSSSAGYLVITPQSGTFPVGSTISISGYLGNISNFGVLSSTSISGAGNLVFPINSYAASSLQISYTSGGASANTFDMRYVFLPPSQGGLDPCQSNTWTKSSAVVTAGAAATTQIVAATTGVTLYVCGYQVSQVATAGTLQWKYGTGASCGTGTTNLTGAMGVTASQPISYSGPGTVFTVPSGNALCLTTTGAGGTAAGVVTYATQ